MRGHDPIVGQFFSMRSIVLGALAFASLWLLLLPSSPAQAALVAFLAAAACWQFFVSRRMLAGLRVERAHRPRVFEEDLVQVDLTLHRGGGDPLQLLLVEDQFMASVEPRRRHLLPLLAQGWQVRLHFRRHADRHHGLYLLGPVQARVADPLGIFHERRELPCITRLTVYPRADPLPDYAIPGPLPPPGVSLDVLAAVGQGEEILGVREYRRGDPPGRIHWRSSARRGRLHTVQLNRAIQAELALFLDLTRRSRFGLGGESTTRIAIAAAVSILSRAQQARHRLSLACVQDRLTHYPAGLGLNHLHFLLDRLVILEPHGEGDFWQSSAERALLLGPGSRAVFVLAAAHAPLPVAIDLVRRLAWRGVAVDFILIDESAFIRIYRDQELDRRLPRAEFDVAADALRRAGARVFALSRDQLKLNLDDLLPPLPQKT